MSLFNSPTDSFYDLPIARSPPLAPSSSGARRWTLRRCTRGPRLMILIIMGLFTAVIFIVLLMWWPTADEGFVRLADVYKGKSLADNTG